MNAGQILRILAEKHAQDVFIPECKTGPSWGAKNRRLDAWAMAKSWANPMVTGYEIKVSRSDFMGDNKWQTYLPYCNAFFFVAPHGLLDPLEIPDPCGLMVASKTGSRVTVKKKAGFREVEVPEPLYRYVLMSRSKIDHEQEPGHGEIGARQYWAKWLEDRKFDFDFGRRVSKVIREELQKKIRDVASENSNLREVNKSLGEIKKYLEEMGIDPNSRWTSPRTIQEKREALDRVVGQGFETAINQTISALERMRERVEREKEAIRDLSGTEAAA